MREKKKAMETEVASGNSRFKKLTWQKVMLQLEWNWEWEIVTESWGRKPSDVRYGYRIRKDILGDKAEV